MTDLEAAWLAGYLEGDGCFGFSAHGGKRYPRIEAVAVDRDVLDRCAAITGAGRVNGPYQHQTAFAAKPQYRWRVHAGADVRSVLLAIRPWLLARRAARVDELLLEGEDDGE